MEKKEYEQLKLKLVVFKDDDVLTGSNEPTSNENGFDLDEGKNKEFWS